MKRWFVVTAAAVFSVGVIGSTSAQVPGQGFSTLLCVAERVSSGPGNARVSVTVVSDTGPILFDILGVAEVRITHGASGSTHTVRYRDMNSNARLDCGDTILSVS